jgi:hypothetical protein
VCLFLIKTTWLQLWLGEVKKKKKKKETDQRSHAMEWKGEPIHYLLFFLLIGKEYKLEKLV